MSYCDVGDCTNATRAGHHMCPMHEKRAARDQPLQGPLLVDRSLSPWQRVIEACLDLADADSDNGFRRAENRLRAAAIAWSVSVLVRRSAELRRALSKAAR